MGMIRQAMDIERLVEWAYAAQKVDQALGAAARRLKPSISSTAAMAQILELGTRVDTSGRGASHAGLDLGVAVAEDALTVHISALALPVEERCLVVMHGRRGTRPDWHPEGYGRLVERRNKRGEPAKIWADVKRCRGWIGCGLEFVGTDHALVDFARAEYLTWWRGLERLAGWLAGELTAHEVTGPRCPNQPWADSRRIVRGAGKAA